MKKNTNRIYNLHARSNGMLIRVQYYIYKCIVYNKTLYYVSIFAESKDADRGMLMSM